MKYSAFQLFRQALSGNEGWQQTWRSPAPRLAYDVIIIGGGGHGMATAYYLAREFGIKNIAVLEKGYIGGGNVGRNTTIVRSNYLFDESTGIYEHSLKLWEKLTQDLNFNVMFSQRGVYNLAHTLQDMRDAERRVNANAVNGIDAQLVYADDLKQRIPYLNISKSARYPILGSTFQARGGVARHDAVVWGFARAASKLGVDIIQNCKVTDIEVSANKVKGVNTNLGFIKASQVASVVAGHTSTIANMVRLRVPVTSHPLQAYVSEAMKPIIRTVIMSNAVHGYISQSSKGDLVIGSGIDSYVSYTQRGSTSVINHSAAAILELFPIFSRVKVNRIWAGTVDTCPDACPIISKTSIQGFYINGGWGTGGFKSTPGSGHVFAHMIAKDEPHYLAKPFSLERFATGRLVDEHGAAGVAH